MRKPGKTDEPCETSKTSEINEPNETSDLVKIVRIGAMLHIENSQSRLRTQIAHQNYPFETTKHIPESPSILQQRAEAVEKNPCMQTTKYIHSLRQPVRIFFINIFIIIKF